VKVTGLHSWELNVSQAKELQRQLAARVSGKSGVVAPKFVAGVDMSAVGRRNAMATAAVVVLSYPELSVVELRLASGTLRFPYVPGLLSFREAPLILAACEQLSIAPDLLLADGQGLAHPRRFGIACHLGVFLDVPTIGCAKSPLWGSYEEPGNETGNYSEIRDNGETIGAAVRTKPGVKPVYVSIGHKVDLKTAIEWVLKCCHGYRLPEPLRMAHLAAGGNLPEKGLVPSRAGIQEKLF
jgi:deoxyribonuclease V